MYIFSLSSSLLVLLSRSPMHCKILPLCLRQRKYLHVTRAGRFKLQTKSCFTTIILHSSLYEDSQKRGYFHKFTHKHSSEHTYTHITTLKWGRRFLTKFFNFNQQIWFSFVCQSNSLLFRKIILSKYSKHMGNQPAHSRTLIAWIDCSPSFFHYYYSYYSIW